MTRRGDDGVRGQRPRAAGAARRLPAVAAGGGRHGRVDGRAAARPARGGGRRPATRSRCCSPGSTAASRAASSSPTSAASRSRRPATARCSPTRSTASRCRRSTASRCGWSCPGWYGMTSVKWLARIDAIAEPFDGYQQATRLPHARARRRPRDAGHADHAARADGAAGHPGLHDAARASRRRAVRAGGPRLVGLGRDRGGRGVGRRRRRPGRPPSSARRPEPGAWRVVAVHVGRASRASTSCAAAPATAPATSSRSTRAGTSAATRTTSVQRVPVTVS